MSREIKIRLLHNHEVDLDQWDQAVTAAPNCRVYAESWYLDIVEPDWLGLVVGNYDYVMPVLSKQKLGIKYAYQAPFAQQLGIYPPATPEVSRQIIHFLKANFLLIEMSLNALNVSVEKQIDVEVRKNHLLGLKNSYDELFQNYDRHTRRYVRKARSYCELSDGLGFEEFMAFKKQHAQKSFKALHQRILQLIVFKTMDKHKALIYGAYTPQNELCAAAFFLKEKKRYTYLNAVSSPEGKEKRAMFAIIDRFIHDHAGKSMMLDFEGSQIEGIARFFEGFGARPENYQFIRYNHLPWYIKWLKKAR
ncbi:hypothetical protein [Roseimarinus sediminis]|uniref:hypothetical protein n=1 Tax=Roseimarinus sediminis TaxID=1610899 RepID=UPI003D25C880